MMIIAVLLTCLMLIAAISDLRSYIIPNWLVAIVLLLYPVMLYCTPVRPDWLTALLLSLGIFIAGFFIFTMGWMGGGDVKLLAVAALWTGPDMLLYFLFWVTLLGGLHACVIWLASKSKGLIPMTPFMFNGKLAMPYGPAIVIPFLVLLWTAQIPGMAL